MKTIQQVFAASVSAAQKQWLEEHRMYLGDLHNHCAISYGHGSLSKAIAFAQSQLDFFTVTGHFAWPDMEDGSQPIPQRVVDYHKEGFAKLRGVWEEYLEAMRLSASGGIVPFVSYEFHSFKLGDYTIIRKDLYEGFPPDPEGIDTRLDEYLATNDPKKSGIICMPHHIGYKKGYRGINWDRFNETASPIVEIMSMHGASESRYVTPAYLHTMGPVCGENTMQGGLARGFRFGVVGSTDHHNASPGAYGSGRAGVWAKEKSQDGIWDGLLAKRTIALTGDPIRIASFLEDRPIGSVVKATGKPMRFDSYILAPSALAYAELLVDNLVVKTFRPNPARSSSKRFNLSLGWGQRDVSAHWKVTLRAEGAVIVDPVPRFKGEYVVDPLSVPTDEALAVPSLRFDGVSISMSCNTSGNISATTDNTQGFGFGLETDGPYSIILHVEAEVAGETFMHDLLLQSDELQHGPSVLYTHGFVSPALRLSEEIDLSECMLEIHESLDLDSGSSLYVRSFSQSGDTAWSTPIWID